MQEEKIGNSTAYNKKTIAVKILLIYCPLFIVLYNLTGNLSNVIYLPTLPALTEDFHTSTFLSQFSMTVWFLGVALPQVYFGLIADKIGYKPLMLMGGALFMLATLCCWFAPNIYVLLFGRFLQGVGVSSLNISTFATLRSHHYEESDSVRFISWVNITGSLAPLISPVIGGLLFEWYGWRSTFACIFFMAALSILGLYFFMIEGSRLQNKNMQVNLSTATKYYKKLLNKKLITHTISYTAFLAGLIAYLITAPFIIKDLFHIPMKYFGLTQILPFLFFILGSLMVNKLTKKMKLELIIRKGLKLSFVAVIALIGISCFPAFLNIYTYVFIIALFLLSFGFVGGPIISEALSACHNKGGAAAILSLSMALMSSLASFLMALFYQGNFRPVGLIIAFFIGFGILNYVFLKE